MGNALEVVRTGLDKSLCAQLTTPPVSSPRIIWINWNPIKSCLPSAMDTDIDVKEIGAFYKLTKLVWNREENFSG